MKFINHCQNTVYLEDIDRHIPFQDSTPQDIDLDDIKKSRSFRQFVLRGRFEVTESGNTHIERTVMKLQKEAKKMAQESTDEPEQVVDKDSPKLEVKLKGHLFEAGGYAKVNRNLVHGLNALGVNVKIDPIQGSGNTLNEMEYRVLSSLQRPASRNAIYIDSIIPSFSNISQGKYKILYTTVESKTIPDQFVEVANQYNEVWVTSNFCGEVLANHGVERPICVMPDSINMKTYQEEGESYVFRPSLKKFVFVSVFGWSYRKGYDVLLKAFLKAFNGDDDVSLLLVSRFQNNPKRSDVIQKDVETHVKKYGGDNPAHIVRCSRIIPEFQMPNLYRACDAFVLFTRGEGYGLPYAESSLCGLPVIATNFSGHTMFLKPHNSALLEPDRFVKMQPGQMHVHYWDDQEFPALTADKTIDEAAALMRSVYGNYDEYKVRNKRLQQFLLKNYSIRTVATRAKERLEQIWRTIT